MVLPHPTPPHLKDGEVVGEGGGIYAKTVRPVFFLEVGQERPGALVSLFARCPRPPQKRETKQIRTKQIYVYTLYIKKQNKKYKTKMYTPEYIFRRMKWWNGMAFRVVKSYGIQYLVSLRGRCRFASGFDHAGATAPPATTMMMIAHHQHRVRWNAAAGADSPGASRYR